MNYIHKSSRVIPSGTFLASYIEQQLEDAELRAFSNLPRSTWPCVRSTTKRPRGLSDQHVGTGWIFIFFQDELAFRYSERVIWALGVWANAQKNSIMLRCRHNNNTGDEHAVYRNLDDRIADGSVVLNLTSLALERWQLFIYLFCSIAKPNPITNPLAFTSFTKLERIDCLKKNIRFWHSWASLGKSSRSTIPLEIIRQKLIFGERYVWTYRYTFERFLCMSCNIRVLQFWHYKRRLKCLWLKDRKSEHRCVINTKIHLTWSNWERSQYIIGEIHATILYRLISYLKTMHLQNATEENCKPSFRLNVYRFVQDSKADMQQTKISTTASRSCAFNQSSLILQHQHSRLSEASDPNEVKNARRLNCKKSAFISSY